MKKSILFAMFLGGVFAANAQFSSANTSTPGVATGTATLNVNLHPIQTLIVNTSQKTVNLDYKTVANYTDGVTSKNNDHLTVYSTGGFTLSVRSADANLTSAGSNNTTQTIPASGIKLTAKAGTGGNPVFTYSHNVELSKTDQTLVTSDTGGFNKPISVDYIGAQDYMDKYSKDGALTPGVKTYTTTVT